MNHLAFKIAAKRAQLALDALATAEDFEALAATTTPARRRKAEQSARECRESAAHLAEQVHSFAL